MMHRRPSQVEAAVFLHPAKCAKPHQAALKEPRRLPVAARLAHGKVSRRAASPTADIVRPCAYREIQGALPVASQHD